MDYSEPHLDSPLVAENTFKTMAPEVAPLPVFSDVQKLLPSPRWDGHSDVIAAYSKAWELAFKNLRLATPENGFKANYIDTAFNGNLFMWDSVFICMFGRYGRRAFNFQRTLDNFYGKQHQDGFISREIRGSDGKDDLMRFDPTSTGPNILAWSEWEYYLNCGDQDRLRRAFPALLSFHRWMKSYRTWPDGSYWATGWACGMDNQYRVGRALGEEVNSWYHGHLVWVDTCLQQIHNAKILLNMAEILGSSADLEDIREEQKSLSAYVNHNLWNDSDAFFHDRSPDGTLTKLKSIGAYWALLADLLEGPRKARFIEHLRNPAEFNRPHRVPTLSADDPDYAPEGAYWRGSIWPNTNYMVLRGLSMAAEDALAHEIGRNHVEMLTKVFQDSGTLWENYAPEFAKQGVPAKPDFVGWSGLGPIAIFFEYVLGLRPDVGKGCLVWDIRLLEGHGVANYPFGADGLVQLSCEARASVSERPVITASSDIKLDLVLHWEGGTWTQKLGS